MSLEVIKTQIREFLRSKEPEVLAIRGDWGVGKTFTWDETLRDAQRSKKSGRNPKAIGLNYYSYVSLFGISSLQDLRTEIAFNKVNTLDLELAEGVTKFQQASGKYMPKILSQALKYAGINAGTLVDTMFASISNSMIKETIVCIDDFERSTIGEKEALGFINDLKSKRNCKIVLLLNDQQTKEYKTYREKVIDYDVEFRIDPIETANILTKKSNDRLVGFVQDNCIKIGVTNLRIIKKILNLLKQAKEQHKLDEYIDDVQNQFATTLILATYCFYGHDEDAPSVDFLLDLEKRSSTQVLRIIEEKFDEKELSEEEQSQNELHKKWDDFLNRYGYYTTDNFDETIINSVISGYIDKEKFFKTANQKQKIFQNDMAAQDIKSSIDSFYTVIMDDDQVDQYCINLERCLLENIENARPRTLNESYIILKRLGKHSASEALAQSYVKAHSGNPEFFDLEDFGRRIEWDKDLKLLMEENYKKAIKVKPPKETFKRLILDDNPVISELDISSLEYLTESDIEDLLRNSQFTEFKKTVKLLLLLNSHDTKLNHVYTNTIKVLQEIAQESEQNKLLVEYYGVSIGKPD